MLANAPLASLRPSDGLWKMHKRGSGAILKLPAHKCRVACLGKTRRAGLCRVVRAFLVRIPSLQTSHQLQDETWTAPEWRVSKEALPWGERLKDVLQRAGARGYDPKSTAIEKR